MKWSKSSSSLYSYDMYLNESFGVRLGRELHTIVNRDGLSSDISMYTCGVAVRIAAGTITFTDVVYHQFPGNIIQTTTTYFIPYQIYGLK